MIEGLLWRDLSGLRQVSGDTATHGLLDGWLAELREAMLRDADSIDREYRLKVLEIAAKRLRERVQVVRPQPGTEAG
jgi:hypothetical protein